MSTGSFNMDTPWLYVYIAQKLTQPQRGITQFSSEVTTRKLVNMRSVTLEGFYKDRGKERQGRLHLFTPTASYIKVCVPSITSHSEMVFLEKLQDKC